MIVRVEYFKFVRYESGKFQRDIIYASAFLYEDKKTPWKWIAVSCEKLKTKEELEALWDAIWESFKKGFRGD